MTMVSQTVVNDGVRDVDDDDDGNDDGDDDDYADDDGDDEDDDHADDVLVRRLPAPAWRADRRHARSRGTVPSCAKESGAQLYQTSGGAQLYQTIGGS